MFNIFKSKTKEPKTIPPFEGLRFGKNDGSLWKYVPAVDITAHEVALLLPLFYFFTGVDRWAYIDQHKLNRHFVKEEKNGISGSN